MVGKLPGSMHDLILLDSVSEDSIVDCLVKRYEEERQIYTYIGPILILINPYCALQRKNPNSDRKVSIDDPLFYEVYHGKQMHEVEPHPFALAEAAYSSALNTGTSQCILITGESGAGKTEASKQILNYIATMSIRRRRSKSASIAARRMSQQQKYAIDQTVQHVKQILVTSTLVLEAFGNAQTIRNNNSSRFGKYMILQMNYTGQIVGGVIRKYLLEESRVCRQAEGERNFHIFYQLLSGASNEDRNAWSLMDSSKYAILQHGHRIIDGIEDQSNFVHVRQNMVAAGIPEDSLKNIFEVLAAVLWIGNISFRGEIRRGSATQLETVDALAVAARLLGVEEEVLECMLTRRTVVAGTKSNVTSHAVSLDFDQSMKVRDTLAKTLYRRVFDWIVRMLNDGIDLAKSKEETWNCSIGILDIYGFEIFPVNRFEQLCINYINERLQQFCMTHTIKMEQDVYRMEKVSWESIDCFDNNSICLLLDQSGSPSLFGILDEQCLISDSAPTSLINKYNNFFVHHEAYKKPRVQSLEFSIMHYAGEVTYDVGNFIESNHDTFYRDIQIGLQTSTSRYIKEIFEFSPDSSADTEKRENNISKRPLSTSSQFRAQSSLLMKELDSCIPYYLRCIKPNASKQPLLVNQDIVRHQVKYLGLLENLRVRRAGFCYRETYVKFLHRYKMLSTKTWPNWKPLPSLREACRGLLSDPSLHITLPNGNTCPFIEDSCDEGSVAYGITRIFIKHPRALFTLEDARRAKLHDIVKILETGYLKYLLRKKIHRLHCAYELLHGSLHDVLQNCEDRKMRRPGSLDTKAGIYRIWNEVSGRLITPQSFLHQKVKTAELNLVVCWTQSYVRRQSAVRRLCRLKYAVAIISASWKGLQVRRRMDLTTWTKCHEAMLGLRIEFERFMGQKRRRRKTLDRVFTGDSLGCQTLGPFLEIMERHKQKNVFFSREVQKINQRFVAQGRILLVTETCVFNIKASRMEKPKERRCIHMKNLASLSLSTFSDDIVVLHCPSEYDYVFEVDAKTELVQMLRERYWKNFRKELPVKFSHTSITFAALPNVFHRLEFQEEATSTVAVTYHKHSKTILHVRVGSTSR